MFVYVPRGSSAQGGIRPGRMIERFEEAIPVPVREHERRLLAEPELVLGNDAGLADAQLGLADLLDDDGRVGERFGQTDPPLGVGRAGFGIHSLLLPCSAQIY